MNTGIYSIRNIADGKRYIGSAKSFTNRFRQHKNSLKRGDHHSIIMQRAWNKYGSENFVFEKLIICKDTDLLFYEQRAIDAYDVVKNGYNISPTAGNSLGVKSSNEKKLKLSKIVKAQWEVDGHREKMSLAHKGQVVSDYCKQKTSEAHKGKVVSLETRKKISTARTGMKFSKETCNKISLSKIGYKASDETKSKMSAAKLGKKTGPMKEETKLKLRNSKLGKKQSEESKEKKSIAMKAAWARRKAAPQQESA